MTDSPIVLPNPFDVANLFYYLPFLTELITATILFLRGHIRHHLTRFMTATCGLVVVACVHGVFRWWWGTSLSNTAVALFNNSTVAIGEFVAQNMVFLLYAALVMAAVHGACSMAWLESVIVVAMGYSVQHAGFALFRSLQTIVGNEMYVYDLRLLPWRVIVFGVIYIVAWIVVGRRLTIDSERIRNAPIRVAFAIGVVMFVVVFNFVISELIDEGALGSRGQTMCYLYDGLCSVLALVILVMASNNDRLAYDLAVIQQVDSLKEQHYEMSRESIELVNTTFHDVRKGLTSLQRIIRDLQQQQHEYSVESSLSVDGTVPITSIPMESVEQMENAIRIYDSIFDTGDDALDTLLTEKSLYCAAHGITITAMADGSAIAFMNRSDVYSLFGNILDNAIEAVLLLTNTDDRQISLTVRASGRLLHIEEDNYYAGTIQLVNGLPATTKGDQRFHGFGMRSIRRQVERYCGEMTVDTSDHIFSLAIVIPIPDRDAVQ